MFKSERVWLVSCFFLFFFLFDFLIHLDVSAYLCGGQEQTRNVFGESAGSAPLHS